MIPVGALERAPPTCAQMASFFLRLAIQTFLRSVRSFLRRVKKRSQAARNRSHTAFSWPGVTGPIVFHCGLQGLDGLGGPDPVGRIGQRLHLRAERFLLPQVVDALDGQLLEERLAAEPQLALDDLVALPELAALLARDRPHLVPLVLDDAAAAWRRRPGRSARAATSRRVMSASCTPALAQRSQPSASRRSCTRGKISDWTAFSRATMACWSWRDGSGPGRVERRPDVAQQPAPRRAA